MLEAADAFQRIKIKSAFRDLQALDVKAGKLFGNAEFVHAQGDNAFTYAFGLGVKIVMVGLVAALLQCLLAFVALFGDPTLNLLAAFAYALSLVLIAEGLFPRDRIGMIILPLTMTTSLAGMIGFIYGVAGIPTQHILDPTFYPTWAECLGVLLAVYLFKFIFESVRLAFSGDDTKPPRPKMRELRDRHLLMPDEEAGRAALRAKAMPWVVAGLCLLVLIALAVISFFFRPSFGASLFIAAYVGIIVVFIGTLPTTARYGKLKKEIYTRLVDEGKLEYITRQEPLKFQTVAYYKLDGDLSKGKIVS